MQSLLKTWFSIAVLIEKPSQLPGDQQTMKFTVLASVVTNIVATLILIDSQFLIIEALLDLVLAGICLYVGLTLWGKPERFIQSFSAYCGVGVVLNLASVLLLGPMRVGSPTDISADSVAPVNHFERFLEYLFLVWSIAAVAHIIRHSFEITLSFSIVTAVLYVLVYILIAGMILTI